MARYLYILCVILLLYPVFAQAKPSLEIELKQTKSEYGKPVYLKIIAEGHKSDLSLLQLDALSTQFAIDTLDFETEEIQQENGLLKQQENGNGTSVNSRQILRLQMYPRQTGKLLIPSFALDKTSTDEVIITILDASNKGSKILLDSKLSSTNVWQREQILVTLTLSTAEQFATIKLADLPVDGVEITALPTKRMWTENENGGKSTITAGWSLLPLQAGLSEIELPPIEYHLNGVVRRVFHLPKTRLNIRPLPSYLPPTLPVGIVDIKSSITSDGLTSSGLLYTDDLAYWNISIESISLTPYWLPPILRQIQSSDDIQFFPAVSSRSMKPDSNGVHGRVDHKIPFKPLQNGFTDMPGLEIQYFDPATGRLETLVHNIKPPFSAGIIVRLLTALFITALFLVLAMTLYRFLLRRIRYRKLHQLGILSIRQANTSTEVVTGLRLVGKAEGWPVNLSLTDWLARWKKKNKSSLELEQTILSLASQHYGKNKEMDLQKNTYMANKLADLVA